MSSIKMFFCRLIAQRVFVIPAGNQSHIPYSRINHNKYMLTDTVAYVGELQTEDSNIWMKWSEVKQTCVCPGTSNWSADYFNTTAGVGLVLSQDARGNSFHQQLRAVFDRDWSSRYSHPLADLHRVHDCAFTTPAP